MSIAYRVKRTLPSIRRWFRNCAALFWRALVKYDETDGEQRAASFAYYAFFALFPLIVLIITVSTMFVGNQEFATVAITNQVKVHLPVESDLAERVIRTIQGVVRSRGKASIIAPVGALYPVVSIPIAVIGFGERLGGRESLGIVLALISVVALCWETPVRTSEVSKLEIRS